MLRKKQAPNVDTEPWTKERIAEVVAHHMDQAIRATNMGEPHAHFRKIRHILFGLLYYHREIVEGSEPTTIVEGMTHK